MEQAYNNEEESFAPSAENPDGPRYAMHREEKEIPPYSVEDLANLPESKLEKLFENFHD
ncbi:Uncharacterised protein [uncultured archaeon]|nr:Uncharacterised protein [uncultured archaeon]